MSNEEFEKKMEFIVEQQAGFASKIGQIEDIVARLANATLTRFEDINEKLSALVDSQIRLTESQAITDEKLRTLIAVVDRYFSENGRPGKSQT